MSFCLIYRLLSLVTAYSKPGLNMVKNELTISSLSGVNPCSTHQTMHDHNAPVFFAYSLLEVFHFLSFIVSNKFKQWV